MSRMLGRLLNIRPEEGMKVFMLVMIFFLFITGTAWAETIIESSFYYLAGVSRLSQVFTLHALVSLIATAVYTAFVDRSSNQRLLVAVCALAVLAIVTGLALLRFNEILAYTILYVLVRAVRTAFVIHWWNYASDFYDARAAKRIVPVITSASRFAIIVAGLTIPLLNAFLTPAAIILLWVATLLIIAMLSWVMNRVVAADSSHTAQLPQRAAQKQSHASYLDNIREGFQYVSSSTYLRWLALSTFLMVIIFAMLNYGGGLIFTQQLKSRAEITNFIGFLNGLTNLLMLPVQLFLFSRVVSKIGVGNANVIFPAGTLLIAGSVLLAPGALISGALAHFDRNTFRYSTQESSNNLLYNAVPARIKGRARSFIDGAVLPVALLASSALLEVGKLLPANLFLPVLLGLPAVAYLLTSLVIRRLYSRAMITLLEQEDYLALLPSDESVALSADPAAKNILLKKLADSHDEAVILLIARIMTETVGTSALPILELKARESQPSLRAGIIDVMASAEKQSIAATSLTRFYTSFLHDADERVRLAAFTGLQRSADTTSPAFLDQAARLLRDALPEQNGQAQPGGESASGVIFQIRSQALACLLNSSDPTYYKPAEVVLEHLLHDRDPRARACAMGALGRTSDPRYLSNILGHLDDHSDQVRLGAALALEARSALPIPIEVTHIILAAAKHLLNDPQEQVRMAMLTTLCQGIIEPRDPSIPRDLASADKSIPESAIKMRRKHLERAFEMLAGMLVDPAMPVRKHAAEILIGAGAQTAPTLLGLLNSPAAAGSSTRQSVIKAVLCRIDVRQYGSLVDDQILAELKTIYTRHAQLLALQPFGNPGGSETAAPRGNAPGNIAKGLGVKTLLTYLTELNDASQEAIFDLLSARHGDKSVQTISQSLDARSSNTRANASEALEALISPSLVRLIMPLFDSSLVTQDLARIGAAAWSDTRPMGVSGVMREFLRPDNQDEWLRAFAIYALSEISLPRQNAAQAATPPSRQSRLGNLLDRLGAPEPKAQNAQTPPNGLPPIGVDEARAMIAAAQVDPSPAVRSAAQSAARILAPSVKPASAAPSAAATNTASTPAVSIDPLTGFNPNLLKGLGRFGTPEPAPATPPEVSAEVSSAGSDHPHEHATGTPPKPGEPMNTSLSVIERIIFLKQVALFQSMTIDQLKVLASICEDEFVPQGTIIFREGDPGGVVYVIVTGRIGIEREGERQGTVVRLATLESRASFGEMNMFENSPRSATAVAVEDSLMLKLRAEPFIALIRQHPDLSLELIKVLSVRIREANDQIAHLSRSTPRQLQKLYDRLEDSDDK